MDFFERQDKLPSGRVSLVQYLLLLAFLGLLFGFWQLQVLSEKKFAVLAEHNRIRTEPIPAPRGRILDREGRVIVDNYPSFTAYLVRDEAQDLNKDLPEIAQGLFLPLSDLQDRIQKFQDVPLYVPIAIKEDITSQDVAFIDAHRDEFPELETMMVSRRLYPKQGYAAAMLGYVSEANDREIEKMGVRPGTMVGQSGIEQYYNNLLMGQDGERRVLVDSRGRVEGELTDRPSKAGQSIRLTIDNDIQLAAEVAMGDRSGAVVALDPRSGDVLAMVSRPTFDPNQFTLGIPGSVWKDLVNNPEHPLMNKAIQAQLAPGSIFKLVMATAGLEQGISEHQMIDCKGGATFYGRYYKCWVSARHSSHGLIGIHQAIAQSCDVYFYTLGQELGIETIARYAKGMGLGKRTGIDLPHEMDGLVPSEEWKEQRFHQPWWKGETISVAIGQGALQATPLQLAHTIGGLVMDGVFMRPHLLMPGQAPANAYPNANYPAEFTFPIHPETVATITAAMRDVVEPGGTAASAHIQGVDYGGKTGTAQTISNEGLKNIKGSRKQYIDNAWFVGVYPLQNPQIVVCVLYQHGREGYFAGRIAAQVIEAYHEKQVRQQSTHMAKGSGTTPLRPVSDDAGTPAARLEWVHAQDFRAPLRSPVEYGLRRVRARPAVWGWPALDLPNDRTRRDRRLRWGLRTRSAVARLEGEATRR